MIVEDQKSNEHNDLEKKKEICVVCKNGPLNKVILMFHTALFIFLLESNATYDNIKTIENYILKTKLS